MPHVVFVPFTGFRVREAEMLELGMRSPGLQPRAAALAELPALGLLTLAGMTVEPWTCRYRPAEAVTDDLIQEIVAERPDLVAISALTASIEEAYRFSRRLKRENVLTVLGGLHATACPEEARQSCDAVVVGNGEPVWPQVLQDAAHGRLDPIYRAADRPIWPLPRFDLLQNRESFGACGTVAADVRNVPQIENGDPAAPRVHPRMLPPRFTLQTERGCPLACEFCGASRLLGRFREKPVDRIRRELDAICAIDSRPLIELADDNTFAGVRDVSAFFDAFEDSEARWFTEADWRIGERPEILLRLAHAGCVQVLVGIESLVFRYPGLGEKRAELNRILDAVEALQQSGVAVNGCFIVGAEGETRQSLDRLIDFLFDSPFAEIQVTLQTPFPGTALYRRLQRQGRLLAERDWSHYTLFDVTYQPDRLSIAELEEGFRDVVRQVHSQEATARREQIRRDVWHRNARLRR